MHTCHISFSGQAIRLLLALLFLSVLGGCLPRERGEHRLLVKSVRPPHHTARFNSFLTLEDKQGPAIQLKVANLEILADGLWLPLTSGPITIDSVAVGKNQLFLGGEVVPPGQYQKLRLTVTAASIRDADGKQVVLLAEPLQQELTLPQAINLRSGDSETLLFTWDVENSLTPDNRFSPQFFVGSPLRNLPINLVFVACPDIDTVFVVRTDKNWVVDSLGLTGRPTYLAIDPSAGNKRLYVLTPDEKMVKVVDLSSYRVVDSYPTLNDEVTFLAISPDGQWAYLMHEMSGYVSRMNLQTGQIGPRVMLGSRPSYAAYLSQQKLLAVSVDLTQRVLLLDPESLRTVRTFFTGGDPEGVLVVDNQLYVAERDEGSVSKNDLSNQTGVGRLMVGFGPRRLVNTGNQIFVSNYDAGSLSILVPGQFGVAQEIYGLGQPFEMVFDQFYRQLYVADQREDGLAVIDVNSNQLLGYIFLGGKPLGMSEIQ